MPFLQRLLQQSLLPPQESPLAVHDPPPAIQSALQVPGLSQTGLVGSVQSLSLLQVAQSFPHEKQSSLPLHTLSPHIGGVTTHAEQSPKAALA
jgi:hypothetical protein